VAVSGASGAGSGVGQGTGEKTQAIRLPGNRYGPLFDAVAWSLDQTPVFASQYLLRPLAGAPALGAQRQIPGGHLIFVARGSDGLAAEAENAEWAKGVADPSWCVLGRHELLALIRNLRLE
jgi:hypothetical protein